MNTHAVPPQVDRDQVQAWRTGLRTTLSRQGAAPLKARQMQLDLERSLRRLAKTLHHEYLTPHLGNWRDPTAEFVFILLSRKTAERAYAAAFRQLAQSGTWDQIADASLRQIIHAIHGSGLENKKALALREGLREIRTRLGTCDLSLAAHLDDLSLLRFLSSMPEVGPKSARCVMLYSFGRAVFPVDAHVGRVLARLGLFSKIGLDLTVLDHKQRQRALAEVVPPDLRYGLHVNLLVHGRTRCRASSPHCASCFIASMCLHAARKPPGPREPQPDSGHRGLTP